MAVTTEAKTSFSVQGFPQIASAFNPFDMHKSPQYDLGYKVEMGNGNVYRYSHFGADTNRGVIVSTDVSESSYVDTDNVIVASASAVTTTDGTIGSRFIEITLASITANQFMGGLFITTDDSGEGYTYPIIGNTATGSPATGNFRIELAFPLQIAVTVTTDFAIQGSKYANLEIATAATDTCCAGVTCSTMVVATAAYGWILEKGIVGILQDGTIALGDPIQLSDGVNGAVQVAGGATASSVTAADLIVEEWVGVCLIDGDDTGHGVFKVVF